MQHMHSFLKLKSFGGGFKEEIRVQEVNEENSVRLSHAHSVNVSVCLSEIICTHTHAHTHTGARTHAHTQRPAFPVIRQQSRSIIRTSGPK